MEQANTGAKHTPEQRSEAIEELLDLLRRAQQLGLTFDIGSAYISRSYIDKQDELNRQINAAIARATEAA